MCRLLHFRFGRDTRPVLLWTWRQGKRASRHPSYYTPHLPDKAQADFTRWSLAAGPSVPEQTGTPRTPRSPRCYWVCPPRWPTERLGPSDRLWGGPIYLRSHTWPSFWHKMPNLKLRDTLCSSKVVMSSGAWRMSETGIWEDPAEIKAPYLIFMDNFRGLPWGSRPLQNLRRSLGRRASRRETEKTRTSELKIMLQSFQSVLIT